MFTKSGLIELHTTMHERLDLLLNHVAKVPDNLFHRPIAGFGHPSVRVQLGHIVTCEEGWVHDLQNRPFDGWDGNDCPAMEDLRAAKERVRGETQAYLEGLSEQQLNTTLATRPESWGGELR